MALKMGELKENWASGSYTDQEHFATAIANAKAIGMYQALEGMFNLDYDVLGEIYEEH